MAEPDFWTQEAVRLGKWFKANCTPCPTCGELTCNYNIHTAAHTTNTSRFEALEQNVATLQQDVAALDARVTALENPPA